MSDINNNTEEQILGTPGGNEPQKVSDQTPIDMTRVDQTDTSDEKVEGYGFFDMMSKGVGVETMGKSSNISSIYLENEEDAYKKFEEQGLEEDQYGDAYEVYKDEFSKLKNGDYSGNNNSQYLLDDIQGGETILERVDNDLYNTYSTVIGAPIKYANQYTYLDRSSKRVWNEEAQEFQETEMGFLENVWNNSLVFGQDYDENGRAIGPAYQRDLKQGEDWYTAQAVSAFSNPKVYGNSIHQLFSGIASGFVVSGVVKLVGVTGELVSHLSTALPQLMMDEYKKYHPDWEENMTASSLDSFINSPANFFNQITRYAERFDYKPSDQVSQAGFTGGGFAETSYHAMKVVGEFLPQVAAAYATGGSSIGTSLASTGTRIMAKELLAKGVIKNVGDRMVLKAGLKLASKEAAKGFVKSGSKGLKVAEGVLARHGAEIAAKSAIVGIMKKSVKGNLARMNQKFMLMGTMQSTGMNYFELRQNGIDDLTATAVATVMAPIMYATERVVGIGYLRSKLGVNALQKGVSDVLKKNGMEAVQKAKTEALTEVIGKAAKNAKSKLGSIKGVKDLTKNFSKSFIKKLGGTKAGYEAAKSSVKKGMDAAVDSGTRGVFGKVAPGKILTVVDDLEMWYDKASILKGSNALSSYIKGRGNVFTMVKAALSEGTQESLEQSGYILGYYMHDNLLADEDATVGQGKMGYESWSRDVMSKKTWHELKENFLGGAYAGGIMSAVTRNAGDMYNRGYLFEKGAAEGETHLIDQRLRQVFEANPETYGSMDHDPSFNTLNKNGSDSAYTEVDKDYEHAGLKKGQKITSQAELNYYLMVQHNNDMKDLYESTGLGIGAMKKFAENNSMFHNGLAVFRDIKKTRSSIAEKKSELEKDDISPDKKSTLETEVAKLEAKATELNTKYEYLMKDDGSGYSKGYKDWVKSARTTISLANANAAETMGLRNKYKFDPNNPQPEFKEKDVEEFLSLRENYVNSKQAVELYKHVKVLHEKLDKYSRSIITDNTEMIKKASEDLSVEDKSTFDELAKDIESEMDSMLKGDMYKKMSYQERYNSFAKVTNKIGKLKDLAINSSSNKEIKSIFERVTNEDRLDEYTDKLIETLVDENGNKMHPSSIKKFIPNNDGTDTYGETDRVLEEGDNRYKDSFSDMDFFTAMADPAVMYDSVESFENGSKTLNEAVAHAKKFGYYDTIASGEPASKKSIDDVFDSIYSDEIRAALDEVAVHAQNDFDNIPDIPEYIAGLEQVLIEVETLKNSAKVRGILFPEMESDKKYKSMLDPLDRAINPTDADAIIVELNSYTNEIRGYIHKLEVRAGQKSEYFIKQRHRDLVMNYHAMTVLFENDMVSKILPASLISKLESLSEISPTSDKKLTKEESKDLDAQEKIMFEIMDEVNKHREALSEKRF